MFYTTEEAAVLGGFLELYLERDSVDPAVRERHRKFRQGLLGGALVAMAEAGDPEARRLRDRIILALKREADRKAFGL